MKALFLGFLMGEKQLSKLIDTDVGMQIQTHQFGWKVIGMLNRIFTKIDSISAIPASSFPKNTELFYYTERGEENGVKILSIPFINVIILKHISRFLAVVFYWCKEYKLNNYDILIIHGVHSPFLIFGLIFKYLTKKKVLVIFTDPPGVIVDGDSLLSKALKSIDKYIIIFLVKKFSGIVLSEKIAEDYMPDSETFLIDGFYSEFDESEYKPSELFTVVYAGMLEEKYGVKSLVNAILETRNPNIRLQIFGRGTMSDYIESIESEKIQFLGYLSIDSVHEYYQKANLLVNPRPIGNVFVKYSFPSKLLEYLSAGIPTMTTSLPSISEDLKQVLHFPDSDSVRDLRRKIDKLSITNVDELKRIADEGKSYVKETRSIESYSLRLDHFIKTIM